MDTNRRTIPSRQAKDIDPSEMERAEGE